MHTWQPVLEMVNLLDALPLFVTRIKGVSSHIRASLWFPHGHLSHYADLMTIHTMTFPPFVTRRAIMSVSRTREEIEFGSAGIQLSLPGGERPSQGFCTKRKRNDDVWSETDDGSEDETRRKRRIFIPAAKHSMAWKARFDTASEEADLETAGAEAAPEFHTHIGVRSVSPSRRYDYMSHSSQLSSNLPATTHHDTNGSLFTQDITNVSRDGADLASCNSPHITYPKSWRARVSTCSSSGDESAKDDLSTKASNGSRSHSPDIGENSTRSLWEPDEWTREQSKSSFGFESMTFEDGSPYKRDADLLEDPVFTDSPNTFDPVDEPDQGGTLLQTALGGFESSRSAGGDMYRQTGD